MYLTQSFRRAAQIGGQKIAVVEGGERRSWKDLSVRVARLAGALRQLDVGCGDRVAILSMNSIEQIEAYFAVFWVGAICVPLNIRWTIDELTFGLSDCDPKILFVDESFADLVQPIRDKSELNFTVIATGGPATEAQLSYEALIEASEPCQPAEIDGEAPAFICYTGGTTGLSKGVVLSHLGVWSSTMGYGLDALNYISEDTVNLMVMPLFHIGGITPMLATVMGAGRNILMKSFDPQLFLTLIQDEQITHTALAPTMIRMLLDQPNFADFDLSSIQLVLYGSAPMSRAQIEEAVQKMPHVQLQQGYGQTELSPYISMLKSKYHSIDNPQATKLSSAGTAGSCCEIIIADEEGQEIDRGRIGEILVRGPNVMLGYWNRPEENSKVFINGWIKTGDAGYMDDDGFIFIIDRLKDMIISGGENIYSSEVENALATHPSVSVGVVIGIPHERWGETVHAIIVLREGKTVTADELIDHCRARISRYKCPRSVEFRTSFPLSAAGKILKRELRKDYWEGRTSALV